MESKSSLEIDLSHIEKELVLFIDSEYDDIEEDTNETFEYESRYQIKEGCFYDYKFSKKSYRLNCPEQSTIVRERKRDKHIGRIEPNIFVGALSLEILENDERKGSLDLEVQSTKTSYREDYRYMLNSIADKCTDLILQSNSPVSHTFESDFNEDSQTLYQRFAFVNSMINSDEFEESIQRIISSPATQWSDKVELNDVRNIKQFRNSDLRKLINSNSKQKLPPNHALTKYGLSSIATKIETKRKSESVDTPENRFIKHALETFLQFSFDISNHPNAGTRLKREAKIVIENLESHLQHDLFKEVSQPTTLKLNSPTLQRKGGYREILNLWIKYDLAAKLIWSGGEDVYQGGKKDIATLYEYWLFFKFLDVLTGIFKVEQKAIQKLIVPSTDGFSLMLKQGRFTPLSGTYTTGNRNLNIRFNYNRTFVKNDDIAKAGSWSTTLRPDYTLSIWPTKLTEKRAEEKNEIVHIHFDAKYKVSNIKAIMGDDDLGSIDNEKNEIVNGVYKNVDLLKMHAYKDAIRRTSGAYVVYPGDKNKIFKGFHEILPGLGAFPIKPTENIDETAYLEEFIKDVLNHFLNRSTQRENIAVKSYQIHKDKSSKEIREPLPEYLGGKKLIPSETNVLVGFYKDEAHYDWIKKGLYNFRMGSGNGSLILDKETVGAKYLLLHTFGDDSSSDLWEITSKGPKVFSKEDLINKGYPNNAKTKGLYLVINIRKADMNLFGNVSWNIKKLKNYLTGRQSAKPFTTNLSELYENVNK
ncbi:DUF2357 domain-containing protein [Marinicella sp. S1101]|uniref:DUF2357 domain-containing protein n=1 Tax=Marinicella marina TaxID=2996016 RepID=UPI0022608F66|nr:DUF2357 domain-containing protein [Marinicella marina]MCX7554848.1 DUF2357 domain-containing protein [Marinicella marina]MDJ1141506.1 DUF2357 domain-containing protein [Marinicella marina]